MRIARIIIQWLIVACVMFFAYAVAGAAIPLASAEASADRSSAIPLVAVCLLNSAVLAHLAARARFGGFRLIATLFIVLFGVMTFMSQIESAFFLEHVLPEGTVSRIFAIGAIISVIVAPSTALVFGRLGRNVPAEGAGTARLSYPRAEWAWKIGLISLLYLVLYFLFGYFIAWMNPELRDYYHGEEPAGFFPHMARLVTQSPQLVAFQIARSWAWTLLAILILVQIRRGWVEPAVTVGFAFAILMNSGLLLPNPFMPEAVRMTHLVETSISNFLFGFTLVWILLRLGPTRIAS